MQPRLEKKFVVLVAALAIALLGVLALPRVLTRTRGAAGPAIATPDEASARSRLESSRLDASMPSDDDRARDAVAPSQADAVSPTPPGQGVLHLAFVGALDDAPVPDIPYLVRRERGGAKELAHGVSDARGRAEVRDLEENVILVETPRRPPFARRVAACWLARGETKELIVRLDGGARVTGHVVDDLRKPVEGAEILADADLGLGSAQIDFLDADVVAARSGADGRFVLDHVADCPSGVWIVDGEERPERWSAATLFVRKDAAIARAQADVKPGETLDVGDLVLIRLATIAGTVLDAGSVPVAGALVSTRGERIIAREYGPRATGGRPSPFHVSPGEEGFRLQLGETLTDFAGRFELRMRAARGSLAVWSPWGQRQAFDMPELGPGERREELVLKLDPITLLELELSDEQGARVIGPGPTARENGLRLFSRENVGFSLNRASARIWLDNGTGEDSGAVADADGVFRLEWKTAPARIVGLTLELSGYEPLHDALTGKLQRGTRLAYVLKEIPAVRLRLKSASRSSAAESTRAVELNLELQICLATPEQRRSDPRQVWKCCGLGAVVGFAWKGEEREFVLPAVRPRAYWTYLIGYDQGLVDLASFGPFEPGQSVHDIEADPDQLRRLVGAREEPKNAPEKQEPGENAKTGFLSFKLVDAKSGEAIPRGTASGRALDDAASRASLSAWSTAGDDGRAARKRFPIGLWELTMQKGDHRATVRANILVRAGEEIDLGTIALEPAPDFHARLVESDGSPAPVETWLRIFDPSADAFVKSRTARTDADGRFTLHGDLPDRALLEAFEADERGRGSERGAQRLPTTGWREGEEKTFTLGPWQRVEVRVGGAALDPPGNALLVWACPAPGEPNATCDHRSAVPAEHNVLLGGMEADPEPTRRVYHFRMAPGRYQIFGRGLLHEVPVQEIEVRDASEIQAFDLSSR